MIALIVAEKEISEAFGVYFDVIKDGLQGNNITD